MKHTRSCIFVVSIILLLILFPACNIVVQNNSEEQTKDTSQNEPVEQTQPEEQTKPEESPADSTAPTAAPNNDMPQPEVIELGLDEIISVDLYGTGDETMLELAFSNGLLVLHVSGDGYAHELLLAEMPDGYLTSAYYVHSFDGYPFVVASYDYISDDFETSAVRFSGTEPVCDFRLPLYVENIDELEFSAYGYLQAAGTWAAGTTVYFVDDDIEWRGTYVLDQQSPTYTELEVAKELPVKLLNNGEYEDSALLPGAPLSFTVTDGDTYMEFVLWDGTEGVFYFEWSGDWIETIDGVPVYEYFVNLPQFG